MIYRATPALLAILLTAPFSSASAQTEPSRPSLLVGAAALPITPVDGNGRLWQEPYHDSNGNGRYDAPYPRRWWRRSDSYTDMNQNGKWDGPFLAGFKHKKAYYLAESIHDPIWARAVVFELEETKIALVALDVVGLLYPEVQRIRREVAELEFDYILIASTHTHSAPDSLGLWGPNPFTDGKDPRFMDYIRRQTVQAIRNAADSVKPAQISLSGTQFPDEFGQAIYDKRDPIVIDNRLLVLKASDLSGKTIAILVNGSAHPETLGGVHAAISSDFPHYLREALENGGYVINGNTISGWGGTALYFSGAVGGLLTTLGSEIQGEAGEILPQRSFEKTRRIGELSAWAVTKALKGAGLLRISKIKAESRTLFLPADNRYFRKLLKKGVLERMTFTNGEPAGINGEDIQTEVGLITLYGDFEPLAQFAAIPGELFPELVQGGHLSQGEECWAITERKKRMDGEGRERIGAAHPQIPPEAILEPYFATPIHFIIGLANDELGYIVPSNDFVFPDYFPGRRVRNACEWRSP